ncbi:MAG: tRNA uridine-5-carboxymethylaminomethyl(34) synthesis GTPase MnmE [Acidobacteria bacterium]|nr:tRNA uridine-5-carboxymethylaminomethyl(34) synthesis GTPase MnmE [Acidobacteriota bacterium]
MFSPTDTIVAIATPSGRGGIGVVRISGARAADVARAILTTPHELTPRYATHTFVRPGQVPPTAVEGAGDDARQRPEKCARLDAVVPERAEARDFRAGPSLSGVMPCSGTARTIDEVVVTLFPAPHSYTTEDVVEISAHGSPAVLREIVRAAIGAGARLAEPGEFTFRAYLGGRIDLVQAEAVGDLVDAVTPLQARVAFDQLEGTLTRSIAVMDAALFDLVAKLEASIDFPDEGYHFVAPATVAATLRKVRGGIDRLLAGARTGRVIREGRQIAIVGKPNVGKSSLFNWLLGAERAIVTDVPGTTRDLLRETIDFNGVRLSLVDTAGSRDVQDEIEREGVARAHRAHDVADLVCVVLDASRPLDVDDEGVLARTARVPRVIVVNKIDLPRAWILAALRIEALEISLKTGAGLSALHDAIQQGLEFTEPRVEEPMVTNLRHESLLHDARESIARALAGLDDTVCALAGLDQVAPHLNEELVLADLAAARRAFDEVVGKRTSEDVLRAIFERFCVGK